MVKCLTYFGLWVFKSYEIILRTRMLHLWDTKTLAFYTLTLLHWYHNWTSWIISHCLAGTWKHQRSLELETCIHGQEICNLAGEEINLLEKADLIT